MKKRVIALGFFDGVHVGHGELLKRTTEVAAHLGCRASVLTYSEHPSEVIGKAPVKLLNTTDERCEFMSQLYGIDDVIVREFTREYSNLSCEEFFDEIIISELDACHVVAGFDFHFGAGGMGDAMRLAELCKNRGIGCDVIDEVKVDGVTVSSSAIRELIAAGDVEKASKLLGHYHCIIAEVVHGKKLGGQIGFPTINQIIAENIQPPQYGVYLSRVTAESKTFFGITNVGICPTVSKSGTVRMETNIFDFEGDLYGKTVKTEFLKFIREEKCFKSVQELCEQIAYDVDLAKREVLRHF